MGGTKRASGRVIGAAVLIATLAAGGLFGQAGGVSAATPTRTSIMTCTGVAVVRPIHYFLACADHNSYLQKFHWSFWGPRTATGNGIYTVNNCVPNCAGGRFISYPARVVLSLPTSTASGTLFTRMRVAYRKVHSVRAFTYPLPTKPPVG